MRKIFTLLSAVLLTATVFAQAPQKMSYQAVIRNSSDQLITNTQIGMQISILQTTTNGTAVYVETQTPTTNDNGLITIEIGTGTTTDDFSAIDWSAGPYFIKTEADPDGGTTYTISGTSQILSVPFALYAAKTTESDPFFTAWDKDYDDLSNKPDLTGYLTSESDPVFTAWDKDYADLSNKPDLSGYLTSESDPVFTAWDKDYADLSNTPDLSGYLTSEVDGSTTNEIQTLSKSGLTISLSDGGSVKDSIVTYTAGTGVEISTENVISAKDEYYIGQELYGGIIFYLYKDSNGEQHGLIVSTNEAELLMYQTVETIDVGANSCYDGAANSLLLYDNSSTAADWISTNFDTDYWYLPAPDELSLLWHNRYLVTQALINSGYTELSPYTDYWSSMEASTVNAFYMRFNKGYVEIGPKTSDCSVRAVRSF